MFFPCFAVINADGHMVEHREHRPDVLTHFFRCDVVLHEIPLVHNKYRRLMLFNDVFGELFIYTTYTMACIKEV